MASDLGMARDGAVRDPTTRWRDARQPSSTAPTRLREPRRLARIPALGQLGAVLTALGGVILLAMFAAALAAEWTLPALTFAGGLLALFGATLWLTPEMGPDRGAGTVRLVSARQWALWAITLCVAALGGLFLALWYDWLASLG